MKIRIILRNTDSVCDNLVKVLIAVTRLDKIKIRKCQEFVIKFNVRCLISEGFQG